MSKEGQRNDQRRGDRYATPRRMGRGAKILIAVAVAALLLAVGLFWGSRLLRRLELERFPLHYPEFVEKYAQEYALNPYEVMAVIHVESGGRPGAESEAGALGLMQVVPSTGGWIAEKFGEEFSDEMMLDPETNIRYGCWYLRYLHDRFTESSTVWAAYNRGPNKVAEWLEDPSLSADGITLVEDRIPAGETRRYVPKVQGSYDKYKALYPNGFDAEHGA